MESLAVHIQIAAPMGDQHPSGPAMGNQEYPRAAQMALNPSLGLWPQCSFLHIFSYCTNITEIKSNFFERAPFLQYASTRILDDDFKTKSTAVKSKYNLRS